MEVGRAREALEAFIPTAPHPHPYNHSDGSFLAFLAAYKPCARPPAGHVKGFKDRDALLVRFTFTLIPY